MMQTKLRLGLVFPGGGCEADFYRFERDTGEAVRVYFAQARYGAVEGADHHPDALRETARVDWIVQAAHRLSQVPLDAVVWACTSGSFINGRRFAEEQARGIAAATGVPATSTSLAFAAAAHALSARKVSLLATYPQDTVAFFTSFLAEYGITVENSRSLGFDSGWISSGFDGDALLRAAEQAMAPGTQALLIPDTALPTLGVIDALEKRLGLPVLSANAVTLWHGMRTGGQVVPVSGLGTLLADFAEMPAA
ncbi:aspartate/glutamate racemase family protein [Nitratireductor sp. StC3]|uniref:maleate cis-trans isomerase family protein n=1 Tax=Nitratireductor sp. StC3 TaxID=2126741 RepID=UPI000D0CC304|nr:aspartate/glutamate racemase family protein [Nitratireductor sp. StC3]PSM20230.1 hypothetical protein C7T96_04090 [Nitratireductor sp. StC3]